MCTRQEVREEVSGEVNRLEIEMHREFKLLKEDTEKRIAEVARAEIRVEKDNITKFVGFGGLVTVAIAFMYFGNLNADLAYLQNSQDNMQDSIEAVEAFVNRGDRFTVEDGQVLKGYIDTEVTRAREEASQRDETIMKSMEDGFSSLDDRFDRLENYLNDYGRN